MATSCNPVQIAPSLVAAVCALMLWAGISGCASQPKTDRLPPQTMASTAPPTDPATAAAASESPAPAASDGTRTATTPSDSGSESSSGSASEAAAASVSDAKTVVLEDSATEMPAQDRRRALVEAARAERERRKGSSEQIAVITDKNLKNWSKGQLTEMTVGGAVAGSDAAPDGTPAQGESESAATGPSAEPGDPETVEQFWRRRILEARTNWHNAAEEILHLQRRITELRTQFYEEDDPYYRDRRIKPQWDRALDRLEEARSAALEFERAVGQILEEGRRAGALPGWLREGRELEPEFEVEAVTSAPKPREHVVGEPTIAEDPDGD